MADDALEATHGADHRLPQATARARRAGRAGIFPAPLRDYVGGDLAAVNWRPVGMGVRQAILPTARGRVGAAAVHSRRAGACPTTATGAWN